MMSATPRIQEVIEQHYDGTESTIYLVWDVPIHGEWQSFTSYEEAIRFIREATEELATAADIEGFVTYGGQFSMSAMIDNGLSFN